jgi:hypothetical protein
VLGALTVVTSGCALFGSDDVSSRSASDLADVMRPVPTVPSPTSDTEVAESSGDPDAGLVPTETDVLVDPRPDPDAPSMLPPLPESPVVDACARMAELAAAESIATAVGAPASAESVDEHTCRFSAGSAIVEVHFVTESTVETDWFRRDRIEPVGAVSGDAVGISEFLAPGSDPAPGYTIALLSRRQGAVIAVAGSPDDRATAEGLAKLVDGAL